MRRIFRCLQIDAGRRRSPSACSEMLTKTRSPPEMLRRAGERMLLWCTIVCDGERHSIHNNMNGGRRR